MLRKEKSIRKGERERVLTYVVAVNSRGVDAHRASQTNILKWFEQIHIFWVTNKEIWFEKINICEWQTHKYGLNKSIIWKWQTQEYELNHKLRMANIGEGNLVLTYVTGSILGAYRPRPLMKAHNLESPCTYLIFGERKYMFWLYVPISQCTRQCAIKGNKGPQPIFCGPKFQWLNKWW